MGVCWGLALCCVTRHCAHAARYCSCPSPTAQQAWICTQASKQAGALASMPLGSAELAASPATVPSPTPVLFPHPLAACVQGSTQPARPPSSTLMALQWTLHAGAWWQASAAYMGRPPECPLVSLPRPLPCMQCLLAHLPAVCPAWPINVRSIEDRLTANPSAVDWLCDMHLACCPHPPGMCSFAKHAPSSLPLPHHRMTASPTCPPPNLSTLLSPTPLGAGPLLQRTTSCPPPRCPPAPPPCSAPPSTSSTWTTGPSSRPSTQVSARGLDCLMHNMHNVLSEEEVQSAGRYRSEQAGLPLRTGTGMALALSSSPLPVSRRSVQRASHAPSSPARPNPFHACI